MENPPWYHEADSALSKMADQIRGGHFDEETIKNAVYLEMNLMRGVFDILLDAFPEEASDLIDEIQSMKIWFEETKDLIVEIVESQRVLRQLQASPEMWDRYQSLVQCIMQKCVQIREKIREKTPPQRESPRKPRVVLGKDKRILIE